MKTSIADEIVEQLKAMSQPLQRQVLEFAQRLVKTKARGTSGQQLIRFGGSIPADDLQLMGKAIEQDCERVESNDW